MTEQENMDVMVRAIARYNAKDLEGYLSMYDKSVVFHGYSRHLRPGIAGLREHYTRLAKGFPDMRLASEDTFASGEKVVHRFTFYGTNRGEYMGSAPSNKFAVVPGIVIHLFKDGTCMETWQTVDNFSFMTQMGVLPALARPR